MSDVESVSVDIPTPDGVADAYFAHPNDGAAYPGVLYYADVFGIRPNSRTMVDRLAGHGYAVLAPNVFYRAGRTPLVELPASLGDLPPEVMKTFMPLMSSLTPELVDPDAGAYLAWLAGDARVAAGPVGVTGYCMGARLSLRTAGVYPDRVAAAGGFHGGRLAVPEDPSSPHLVADKVTGELYFGHADKDRSLPPEQIELLNQTLDKAGVRYRAEVYPDAPHGYTQSDMPNAYNAEAAERHWTALLDLFSRNLKA